MIILMCRIMINENVLIILLLMKSNINDNNDNN